MRWMALHLPRFALDVFERGRPACAGMPTQALCNRLQVLLPDAAAIAAGLRAGMKRATALALLPGLVVLERDPVRERAALHALAGWALQFTPSVSLVEAEAADEVGVGLLLEVEPSLRLFGGEPALRQRLLDGAATLGYDVRVAVADTATGAWLLALAAASGHVPPEASPTGAADQITALPIGLLAAAREPAEALAAVGVHTIGDVLKLPRAGVARRFGSSLLAEIDRALGRLAEPRRWFEAPARFRSRLILSAQIEQAEPLLFAARRMLAEMIGWLAARQGATRSFLLLAEHDEPPATRIVIRLAEPSRELERLTSLLRERLGTIRLRKPVHTLHLRCGDVIVQPTGNGDLFPTPEGERESFSRLLERLQTRLGHDRVHRLRLTEDHRPETAYRSDTIERLEAATPQPVSIDDGGLPRPLWLLRDPQPISERHQKPWWRGALTLLAGPERIETGWWDSRFIQRDYFVAEDESHALYWIFRERLPGAGERHGWFLHGRFG